MFHLWRSLRFYADIALVLTPPSDRGGLSHFSEYNIIEYCILSGDDVDVNVIPEFRMPTTKFDYAKFVANASFVGVVDYL